MLRRRLRGAGEVTIWFNQGGRRASDPTVIRYTPSVPVENIRLCDFNGAGTVGLLYADVPAGPVQRGHVFLDLTSGRKPYLLSRIDNGLGLRTSIQYRSSTEYALDDAETGAAWRTFHPFPVHCVAEIETTDITTGETATTTHHYHEGRYDPARRAFLGFRVVDSMSAGDASIPGQRVRSTFHLGVDPIDPTRPLGADELLKLGALRRRLLKTEIYGLDAGPDEVNPYRVTSTHTTPASRPATTARRWRSATRLRRSTTTTSATAHR